MADIDDIAEVVASAIKAATAPLIERLDAQAKLIETLEAREMPTAIKGDPGEVDMDQVSGILSDLVSAAFATIPAPQDGKSVDPEEVRQMVEEAVAALPPAKDGESVDVDALRGIVGDMTREVVGEQLPEAVKAIPVPAAPEPIAPDMEAIEASIREGIAKAVAELPAAKDGADGIGLADALIDKDGHLVVTMTDGRTKALGLVVGKDGERGKDGETFTLDDFYIEQTDERTLEFKFLRENVMHSFELEFPVPIFREAWKEGRTYSKGDMVVWGGSLWAATKDTDAKPDTEGSGWMIAARKGRDGKSAKPA